MTSQSSLDVKAADSRSTVRFRGDGRTISIQAPRKHAFDWQPTALGCAMAKCSSCGLRASQIAGEVEYRITAHGSQHWTPNLPACRPDPARSKDGH